MNIRSFSKWQVGASLVALLCLAASQSSVFGTALEGQNKGDTNTWSGVNLTGWVELDYIPFRVYSKGPTGPQTITVSFLHFSGTTPGFEDLTGFNCYTTNVVFTSLPVLTTDPSGIWSYT